MAKKTARPNEKAPEGQVWVCLCCGKTQENPYDFGDASCFINSELCYKNSLTFHEGVVRGLDRGAIVDNHR